MYDEYINASKGKAPVKGKGKQQGDGEKAESLNGVQHVMSIGSQAVAHKGTAVPSIIQGDSQAGVQSAAQLVIILLNALVREAQGQECRVG